VRRGRTRHGTERIRTYRTQTVTGQETHRPVAA
jgi:hypothetical protein